MRANDISNVLKTAHNTVLNDRGATHGSLEDSFQMIADFWSVYLTNTNRNNEGKTVEVKPVDVAFMMDLLKTARAVHGKPAPDHFVDKAGYSAIAASLSGAYDVPATPPATKPAPVEVEDSRDQLAELAKRYAPTPTKPVSTLESDVIKAVVEDLSKEIK